MDAFLKSEKSTDPAQYKRLLTETGPAQWRGRLLSETETRRLVWTHYALAASGHAESSREFLQKWKDEGKQWPEVDLCPPLETSVKYLQALAMMIEAELSDDPLPIYEQAEPLFYELEKGLPAPWGLAATRVIDVLHAVDPVSYVCPRVQHSSFSFEGEAYTRSQPCKHAKGEKSETILQWTRSTFRRHRIDYVSRYGWVSQVMVQDRKWITDANVLALRVPFQRHKERTWKWRMDMATRMARECFALFREAKEPWLQDECLWRTIHFAQISSIATGTKTMDLGPIKLLYNNTILALPKTSPVLDFRNLSFAELRAVCRQNAVGS